MTENEVSCFFETPCSFNVGICGSALPTQTTFVSTSNSLTLSYHHSIDVASQSKSFNVTFTYFTVRQTGSYGYLVHDDDDDDDET